MNNKSLANKVYNYDNRTGNLIHTFDGTYIDDTGCFCSRQLN